MPPVFAFVVLLYHWYERFTPVAVTDIAVDAAFWQTVWLSGVGPLVIAGFAFTITATILEFTLPHGPLTVT